MAQRIYNHIPDVADTKDFLFVPTVLTVPASVDLRPFAPPIYDQGQLGSCTGNGLVRLREYYMLAMGQPLTNLSRRYLYYKEREIEGNIDQDAGAMIRDGFRVLQKIGCALETDCPYDITKFAEKPSDIAEQGAINFTIDSYHRVMSLRDLKAALANKQPVVFGFQVYESFESQFVSDTGIVPMPDTIKEQYLGGHCVDAFGYDDNLVFPSIPDVKGYVIVPNSWGVGWGDKGYCYMPYAMFDSPIVTDMWVGKYNAPVKAEQLSFLQAIQYYVDRAVLDDPPTSWINLDAKIKAGTATVADYKYVPLLFQKVAAYTKTLTDL